VTFAMRTDKRTKYTDPEAWLWAAAGEMMAMLSLFCWWIW